MKKNILPYILNYIIIILIYHYIRYIGIESIFSIHLFVIPIANYIALKFGIFHKLENDSYTNKKDIFYPFLIITSFFHIVFFYYQQYTLQSILFIVISNILEFVIIKSKKVDIQDITNKNIEEYFKNH